MEFAFSLNRVVDDFNQSLIEFDLILRVGKYTHTHTHTQEKESCEQEFLYNTGCFIRNVFFLKLNYA